ncbi:hypothetical protein QEZ52_05345 [Aliisedimentitalea scapharcae]|uniref:Uncharacterized protein n=1 Tax=Aliisedimentitalea scapharcae TaxID=1524259 RepID=A0ABZ2XXE5_9RHOB|nr:hypothetical protein K3727_05240 [Rhodobacteraceae bacterium M382]
MANNDWILDVLVDLKSFASANGLGVLAEQLDDTMLIAAAEIASVRDGAVNSYGEQSPLGSHIGRNGSHRSA